MFPADTPAELCRSVSLMLWCTALDSDEVVFLRGFNTAQELIQSQGIGVNCIYCSVD